jgi:Tfp pilus assembly protein PilF
MQEPEQLAFASYVLGHVYFSAKRDDLAEKFFRKALATDRNNKDAERHVLILERRKQLHADADAAANRKLFGIQLSNSKPKT